MANLDGFASSGFEEVERAFQQAFTGNPKMGAGLAIFQNGHPVVNLWGGYSDQNGTERWTEDSLSVIFSCTKGLMSMLLAHLVQEGKLEYSDKVSKFWPEFAQNGKAEVTVAELVSHKAGLSAFREGLETKDIADWQKVTGVLANQAPLWRPGTGHAYHAITHGWLVGEVVRRVSGMTPGHYLKEAFGPSLAQNTWVGLPEQELPRVAEMWAAESLLSLVSEQKKQTTDAGAVWQNKAMTLGGALPMELVGPGIGFNDPDILQAQVPGAGGVSTALDLAAIWSSTVVETNGRRILGDAILEQSLQPQSFGEQVWDAPPPWATWGMGFQLASPARTYLTEKSFGHDGAGGQVSFADLENKVGFAFLTNQMEGPNDVRATNIIEALRRLF